MAKVFGKATVKVDGGVLLIDNGAKLNLGGVTRKTVKGTEVHGYAEEAMESSVEVAMTVTPQTSLQALADIDDASVTFEADTGQVYILNHAWLEAPPEMTGGDGGKVPLKFVALACEEMVGG
jgi:hypothetical protein